jgi:hypothetical protein
MVKKAAATFASFVSRCLASAVVSAAYLCPADSNVLMDLSLSPSPRFASTCFTTTSSVLASLGPVLRRIRASNRFVLSRRFVLLLRATPFEQLSGIS